MQTSYKNHWILVNESKFADKARLAGLPIKPKDDGGFYVEVRQIFTDALICFNWFEDIRIAVEWAQARIDEVESMERKIHDKVSAL